MLNRIAILSFPHSSMFFDEDGDLAHEFYEECRVTDSTSYDTVVRWTMRRIKNGLVPQVKLVQIFPYIIYIYIYIFFPSVTAAC